MVTAPGRDLVPYPARPAPPKMTGATATGEDRAGRIMTHDIADAPDTDLYPLGWVLDGLAPDGRAVRVRPVHRSDHPGLAVLARTLGGPGARLLSPDAQDPGNLLDYDDRMAFVALLGGEPVAVACYERLTGSGTAELAVGTAGDTRPGATPLVLEPLVAYARIRGMAQFVANDLPSASPVLRVLRESGLRLTEHRDGTTVSVDVALAPTPAYHAWCDGQQAAAEAASLDAVLRPRTVAVVGAGRRPGAVGHEIVRSLLQADFSGAVFPVNPHANAVAGVPAHPSLDRVPEPVDLAVVAVPPAQVPVVAADAARAGVRAMVVVTSGFAETGPAGAGVEREIGRTARDAGMRVVGPNCLGVYNTDPEVRLQATFSLPAPHRGRIAVGSHSGAVGVVVAERARALGVGISGFVSLGNSLDVSANDLLCHWERDPGTAAVALYLESFGNPRKFARIARRVGRTTPVVVLRAGRSPAGARGARSHTAAAATPDVAVRALLSDCGAVQVDTLDELLDTAGLLAAGPLPAGRRVGLVGNSGGPLILAADACATAGLAIPELPRSTQDALQDLMLPGGATGNPVDLTSGADAATLESAARTLAGDPAVDAVLAVVTPLDALPGADARSALARVATGSSTPVVTCVLDDGAGEEARTNIPTPDRAARALGRVCDHAEWRARPAPSRGDAPWDRYGAARQAVADALAARPGGGWLDPAAAAAFGNACGLPQPPTLGARSADAAAAVADELGFPVALKAASPQLVHKSDHGGVVLGLGSPQDVADAYRAMAGRLGTSMDGVVVQPMAADGVETIVGLVADPTFGPLVMFGLGGVASDLLDDRGFAIPPLGPREVDRLLGSIRALPLLTGFRGSDPVDLDALREVVATVGAIADHLPEVVELDCNPVVARPDGVTVLDCKVRLAPPAAGPGPLLRMLRPVSAGAARRPPASAR